MQSYVLDKNGKESEEVFEKIIFAALFDDLKKSTELSDELQELQHEILDRMA
jgi:hypothetical protein